MAKLIGTFRELPHKFHLPSGKAKASDKQLKQFKEFFDIRQCCNLGYPSDATAFAYDAQLNLMAIGTGSGQLFVCGAPGVQFNAQHADAASVTRMTFLPNEGRLITLTSDNKLHKWELNGSEEESWHLDHVAELSAGSTEEEGERATAIGFVANALWIGYDNGRLRVLDVKEMKFTETETSSETISKSLSDDVRSEIKGWSSIISIEPSPPAASGKQQVAIGFVAGTVAILAASDASTVAVIANSVELECLAWQRDANLLFTGHSDGSYSTWSVQIEEGSSVPMLKQKDMPNSVYGPFPCAALSSIVHKTAKLGAVTAFAGGLAKNTHADRHSVTVLREQEHVCYDLASPVIGIELLCSGLVEAEYDEPNSLLIICQSELLCIDLIAPEWPCYRLPYLTSIAGHSSITVSKLYTNVSEPARAALVAAAASQQAACSKRDWPITGGKIATAAAATEPATGEEEAEQPAEPIKWDLLVTGHADGSVGFWRLDGAQVSQLFILNTTRVFDSADAGTVPAVIEGDYPPFRAIGRRRQAAELCAEPDAAMAIVNLHFVADLLIVGGSAGQVIVWSLSDKSEEVEVDVRKVNADIVPVNSESFEWEGAAAPKVREEAVAFSAPFKPLSIVQLYPPAPVTSIAFSQRWSMLAAGTAHGLAVIDTAANKCISVHSTLPSADSAEQQTQQQPQSTGSQLTKSLRQSFRRFKKLRGGKKQEYTVNDEAKEEKKKEEKKKDKKKDKKEDKEEKKEEAEEKAEAKEEAAGDAKEQAAGDAKTEEAKPEEEAKAVEDAGDEVKAEEPAAEAEPKTEEPAAAADAAAASDTVEAAGDAAEAAEGAEGGAAAAGAEAAAVPQKTVLSAAVTPGQVQCLTFADTYLMAPSARTSVLFAGDNSGRIFAFQLTPASGEGESAKEAKVELSKELHLQHGAPVVCMQPILAGRSHTAVTDSAPSEDAAGAGPHELLVVSQEQVKLFSLPALKPRCKAKLTGQGSQQQRVLACGYGQFESSQRPDVREFGLAVSANTGETMVLSVPQLKLHAVHQGRVQQPLTFAGQPGSVNPLAVRREQNGLMTVLCLSSKFCRYTLKALLELEEGMRPKPVAPEQQAATAAEQKKEETEEAKVADADDENKEAAAADEESGKEAPAELDRSGMTPVAADITLDDIKEYATSSASPPAAETIPETNEEKRESTVSADDPMVNGQSESKVAEVKVSADITEHQQAESVTAGDSGNTEE